MTANKAAGGECRTFDVQFIVGETTQDLLEGDPALQPGRSGAQAMVCAGTERQNLTRLTSDVEFLGVVSELAGVSIG